ncbi:MAG TPA: DJ-1/PfpI family protein [Chitinophagaceae bacterium]|nr:DJ-1/PfpI family protein [Chitinophagaceae bacterium]
MKRSIIACITAALFAVIVYIGTGNLREFFRIPVYAAGYNSGYSVRSFDAQKRNVFLLAYNRGTEIFDIMAPYYLFNLTHKANVYIVAVDKGPVAMMKGFFALPHYTLREADSLGIRPSVIVIPNFSGLGKEKPDQDIVSWIKKRYTESVSILSVCAGSFTASATGLFDGREMTTHASDMKANRKLFGLPKWVSNVSYTKSGNLYSTAGVSNAVEGSLALIKDLFGEGIMKAVMDSIHYPHAELKKEHESVAVRPSDKIALIGRSVFAAHRNIGVLMHDMVDEFDLAAVLDTYHRSFPGSINTFTKYDEPIVTRFGLTIFPTGKISDLPSLDELHILTRAIKWPARQRPEFDTVYYDAYAEAYIFDVCLARIRALYGGSFQMVKKLLDYN